MWKTPGLGTDLHQLPHLRPHLHQMRKTGETQTMGRLRRHPLLPHHRGEKVAKTPGRLRQRQTSTPPTQRKAQGTTAKTQPGIWLLRKLLFHGR